MHVEIESHDIEAILDALTPAELARFDRMALPDLRRHCLPLTAHNLRCARGDAVRACLLLQNDVTPHPPLDRSPHHPDCRLSTKFS